MTKHKFAAGDREAGRLGAPAGEEVLSEPCIACGFGLAAPFFTPEPMPLATLGWPGSAADAQAMPRLPLNFVSCLSCGHVWNTAFDYDEVPYASNPNRMFNSGSGWGHYLTGQHARLLSALPDMACVVEIGCGEGHFLRALQQQRLGGRFIGFDPNAEVDDGGAIEVRQALFRPDRHLAELRPSLILMRHVLEHLADPLAFVQQLNYWASREGLVVAFYAEVPCIDRVPEAGRLSDFYYEHSSQFSTRSFAALLEAAAHSVAYLETGYDGEMVSGLSFLGGEAAQVVRQQAAAAFRSRSILSQAIVAAQLDRLVADGRRVAIWGGTGKAAAFMNHYGADAERFPLVVDSDPDKIGSFVPGTGQEIRSRDTLLVEPADVLIIPMAWRAKDVAEEMQACGIAAAQLLIEHDGGLVDFLAGPHPYLRPGEERESGAAQDAARPGLAIAS